MKAYRSRKLRGPHRTVALLDVIAAQEYPLIHSDLRQPTKCIRLQVDVIGRQNHQSYLSAMLLQNLLQKFRYKVEINNSTRVGFQ